MRQRVLAVSRNRRRRRRRHRRRRRRHRRYRRGTNEPKFYYFIHVISTHFKRKRREICVSDWSADEPSSSRAVYGISSVYKITLNFTIPKSYTNN